MIKKQQKQSFSYKDAYIAIRATCKGFKSHSCFVSIVPIFPAVFPVVCLVNLSCC